ncbi:MAG: group I intron-associated PD-(D/E)XK endonuclease [Gemmataceae bacterium]
MHAWGARGHTFIVVAENVPRLAATRRGARWPRARLRLAAKRSYVCTCCWRNSHRTIRRDYRGEIELFGVYCPDNNKCYLVLVGKAPRFQCHLRIDLPRNGQKTRLHWAEDYEIG